MIRELEPSDISVITGIYNYYIRNTVITFEEEEVSSDAMFSRYEKVDKAGYPWLVAERSGVVVGYAYACPWNERAAYRHTAEISVYLSHSATGNGIGKALYIELFLRLATRSIRAVIGGIALPNLASVALHEKFGMKQVAHFEAVGFKFGQWIDVGYWQTLLPETSG